MKAFLDAGFSEAQALDVITVVALKTLSNYSNHITNPKLNPELEQFAWTPEAPRASSHRDAVIRRSRAVGGA